MINGFYKGSGRLNINKSQLVAPISVIIPSYKCAATVKRAVDSIFKQSLLPSEVIIVEDFSLDETLSVLRELERVYLGSVKIMQMQFNVGAASARNAAWELVQQPYVAFLDADDSWHPDKLKIQYEYMKANPKVTLCGHRCVWLQSNAIAPDLPKSLHVTKISPNSLLFKNAFSTPTVMLKSDISFRFENGRRCAEDRLLWQQIAFAGLQTVRIESPLAYMHKSAYGIGGLSAQLWKMEKGELCNFITLYRAGNIHLATYVTATLFSVIKFIKRLLMMQIRYIAP